MERPASANDVAIVGIALRFPGAHGPAAFWANLRAGVDSVTEFSDEDLAARGVPPERLRDPHYVKRGHVIDGVELFDAEFFGFSPRDAAIMDPQHRIFLECAWEALEDAGHVPERFAGPIGVFAGSTLSGYFMRNLLSNPALVESAGAFLLRHTGNDKDMLTTRASYCLNLTGPSINVQTACSTSLVAVHLARQSLLLGECDMALAGGVAIEFPHAVGYAWKERGILSPDGRCRTFDRSAQGTVFGSGVGLVALRRLDEALADGDRIYAVIRGSAVNNDGSGKVGYMAPSVDGLAAAITEALAEAGAPPESIGYVEAHGSGTPIGVPLELASMTQAFHAGRAARGSCGIGSVKANLGHLDTAAGVAGLIKTALALHHGELPPTPHVEAPMPELKLDEGPFYVVDSLRPWPRGERPRRAGVSSQGIGGTNAHVLLEEAPLPDASVGARTEAADADANADSGTGTDAAREPAVPGAQLLCLSARTRRALDDASRRLAARLREEPAPPLPDVAFTLSEGRRAFAHRRVLVCRDAAGGATRLESGDPRHVFTHASDGAAPTVAFLLPGGGGQHPRMACGLYESSPAFRAEIDRGLDVLLAATGLDLRPIWPAVLFPRATEAALDRPSVQLPAIFLLEHALAAHWAALGVRPDALIGHSLGENVAACLAGVLSFEDALGLVALRGELLESLPAGRMLSVALPAEELTTLLGDRLDLAAVNAPALSVVSGPADAVEELARQLAARGVDSKAIPIDTAAHSRAVDPVLPRFREHLASLRLSPPRVPLISNRTGQWLTDEQAVSPDHWAEQLRGTVRFAEGVRTLLAGPPRVFLEIGPGRTLASLVRIQGGPALRGAISSLPHAQEPIPDDEHLLAAFGRLWACGVDVDLSRIRSGGKHGRVSLPTYPFQRKKYWMEPGRSEGAAPAPADEPRALELLAEGLHRPVWRSRLAPAAAHTSGPTGGPTGGSTGAGAAGAAAAAPHPCQWLVFLDAAGVGEALARRLRARGDAVTVVRESDDNRRLGDAEYALAPERGREGYDALVRDLVARGTRPQRIVHTWLLTPDEGFRPGSNFFHRNQERGFYSLLFLVQALGEHGLETPLHLTVAANGLHALDGETLLHPSKATVLGPARVLPRELPGVSCATVDLPLPVSRPRRRGLPLQRHRSRLRGARLERLVDLLEAEVLAAPRSASVVLRREGRFEPDVERLSLAPAAGGGPAPLRERGVYLVTGGLGDLGLLVAGHLARRAHARIALVSRSRLPGRSSWDRWLEAHGPGDPTSRRILALRAIEAEGGEVLLLAADVTDIEAMRAALEETRARFGALHGVVHAAGVLRDAPILSKTQEETEAVFAAKVHGTLVLDALLRDTDLDFMVCFSSVSALVAAAGQVDYAAANAFLDAHARAAAGRRGPRIVSVAWGPWSETGMAARALAEPHDPLPAPRPPRHPLFASRSDRRDGTVAFEALCSPEAHWLLDEHRTRGGRALLPGTAFLELARAALAELDETSAFEIRDLLLLRPLAVEDGTSRQVEVELRPDALGFGFRVSSRASAGEPWDLHAEARLVLRAPDAPETVPLGALEARCATRRLAAGDEMLSSRQDGAMRFGPRWRALREVRMAQGETLATLELNGHATDLADYPLHPALVDVAMSCGLELPELGATQAGDAAPCEEGLWVPVSFESVRVHAPLPARIRSWVRSRPANRPGSGMLLFDAVLAGEDGCPCVEIDGLAMHRVAQDFGLVPSLRFSPPARVAGDGGTPPSRAPASSVPAPSRRRENEDAPPASPAHEALRRNVARGIRSVDGLEALLRILAAPALPHVVATTLDLDGLRRQAEAVAKAVTPAAQSFERPDLETEFAEPQPGIERTLAGFWQEVLGVDRIGRSDDFFELGGHSLIAVRLFARIKKAFDVDFPISLLFEAPTVERCAEAIRNAIGAEPAAVEVPTASGSRARSNAPRYRHLVAMHPGQGGDGTPFFLVAGMFGNVLNLRHLAQLLGRERRLFGLQALGLYGLHRPHESFEEMAADYLAEVRAVQPRGPYLLGGFSGGGITAYEMALQLHAAGEEVALLAMLDTGLPRQPQLTAGEKARIHWQRAVRRGPAYLAEWVRDRVAWELSRLVRRRRHHEADPSAFRSEEIGQAFRRSLAHYELRRYPGEVTLFRPPLAVAHVLGPGRMTNAGRDLVASDNGWGPHVERVEVHEVPGDHDSMVLEPNVRVLAARLRACLHSAEVRARFAARGAPPGAPPAPAAPPAAVPSAEAPPGEPVHAART